jgi:hypothetical protein
MTAGLDGEDVVMGGVAVDWFNDPAGGDIHPQAAREHAMRQIRM